MNKLDELIQKYTKTFNENFPFFVVRTMPENELTALIEKCISDNKPYTPDYKENADY